MSGVAIGLEAWIGRLGEGGMHAPPFGGRHRIVDRRSNQRMSKRNWRPHHDELLCFRFQHCLLIEAEGPGGAPQYDRIRGRFRRGQAQEGLRCDGKVIHLAQEVVLKPLTDRQRLADGRRAVQPVADGFECQLENRQRVSLRLMQQALRVGIAEPIGMDAGEQGSRIICVQPPEPDFRDAGKIHRALRRLAKREEHGQAFRVQAAGDEGECLSGLEVEPLCVVDDAEQRLLLGGACKQREGGEGDLKPLRCWAHSKAEGHAQRIALWRGKPINARQEWNDQLVEAGKADVGFGLDAKSPGDSEITGCVDGVIKECGLSDSGLAADDQRTTRATANGFQEGVNRGQLANTPNQLARSHNSALYRCARKSAIGLTTLAGWTERRFGTGQDATVPKRLWISLMRSSGLRVDCFSVEEGRVEVGGSRRLQLRLLGPGTATVDGHPVSFRTRKTLALLAYLAMARGPHQRERIADIFWPEADASAARESLRTALVYLRQALGEATQTVLITTKDTVGVTHGGVDVDVEALKRACQMARTNGDLRIRHQIRAGIGLYRGAFLEGLSLADAPEFETWVESQRAYWRTLMAELLSLLATMQNEAGEPSESVASLEQWTSIDPDNELAWRRLVEFHLDEGNLAGAHAAWERYRQTLKDVGAVPDKRMAELQQRILTSSFATRAAGGVTGCDSGHGRSASRSGDLAPLEAAFCRARRGRCEVVVISGAQSGRRRFADEIMPALTANGVDVVEGRALRSIGSLPLTPWISGLRQRLEAENAPDDLLDDRWLAELARLLPELLDRYPDLDVLPADALTRGRTFEAVSRLGIALGQRRPLAILIEDAQWTDPDSRDLLQYAVRRWTEACIPVLVVLVVTAAISSDLEHWVNALEGETRMTRLPLRAPFQPVASDRFAFAGMGV